jgi:uncharacterized RDD family membrane protein YckC
MADQHGSGPLTPGDPLQGGGTPPPEPPAPPPAEPRREPEPGEPAEPPPAAPPERTAPAEREWLGSSPAEPPTAPGAPAAPTERSAPPIAPPAPDEPAARPGSFAPPGYGTSPVPPGAFAAPAAAGDRDPWVLAEWWRRAAAAIIDGVIVSVVASILLIPFALLGLSVDTDGGAVAFWAGFLVFLLLLVIASFLYAPVLMARTDGQTIGKMAVGIRVVRANGRTIEFGWAFVREVVVKTFLFGVLSSFTFGLASLLDWLWPLWDSENRALHDMIVDSRVIRA